MTIAHIDNGEAGDSVRDKLNAVIDAVNAGGLVIQTITSGSSPVTLNPDADIIQLTTGGTKGTETATLAIPSSPATKFGRILTIAIKYTSTGDHPTLDVTNIDNPAADPLDLKALSLDGQAFIQLILQYNASGGGPKWWVLSPLYSTILNTNAVQLVGNLYIGNGSVTTFPNDSTLVLPGTVDASNLPSSDPASVGKMWDSTTTAKISAG